MRVQAEMAKVSVDSDVPPARYGSFASTEYHDVHSVDRPDLRKMFAKVQAWLKEHGKLKP
jgi:hypothetical protein